jgi:hypothetical protein
MKILGIALALIGLTAAPVLAGQCPALLKQIADQTGNRLDTGANAARELVREADALHKAGKHAESEAKAEAAAREARINLIKK